MITAARSTANSVRAHFDALRRKAKWPFFWRMSLEGLIVPVFVAAGLSAAFHLPSRTDLPQSGVLELYVGLVVLIPFFETLLLQTLPVFIARRCGLGFWGQVIASMIPFAVSHFPYGINAGVSAGVVGGFYLAFTYVHWRQVSFRSALWMTAGTHAVHNLLLISILIASGNK